VQKRFKRHVEPFVFSTKPVAIPKPLMVVGDAVVISDVHVENTSEELITAAASFGYPNLIISGDFFNLSTLSRHPHIRKTLTVDEECEMGEEVMDYLIPKYEQVWWSTGNHDDRLAAVSQAEMTLEGLFKRVVPKDQRHKVHFSTHNYLWLESGGEKWLIAHPYEYARTPLVKAQALCDIFHCHVMTAHEHHSGMTMSKDGLYTLVNNPMCADDPDYVLLRVSSMPRMVQGFSVIEKGRANQYVVGAKYGLGE
jgi:hypothetical protein